MTEKIEIAQAFCQCGHIKEQHREHHKLKPGQLYFEGCLADEDCNCHRYQAQEPEPNYKQLYEITLSDLHKLDKQRVNVIKQYNSLLSDYNRLLEHGRQDMPKMRKSV